MVKHFLSLSIMKNYYSMLRFVKALTYCSYREGVCGTCGDNVKLAFMNKNMSMKKRSAHVIWLNEKCWHVKPVYSRMPLFFDHDSNICNAGDTLKIVATVTKVELVSETTAILHVDASSHTQQLQYLAGAICTFANSRYRWMALIFIYPIAQMQVTNCNF